MRFGRLGAQSSASGTSPARREALLVTAAATFLAIVQTYPYAFHLGTVGRVDSTDGQFSIWNVAWVARTIVVDPLNLYNANIFYPHQHTLAYSEANVMAGILAIPGYWLSGGNAFVAHNSVLVLSFILSSVATYYLARRLTGSRGAAAVSSVLFAYCPYIFARTTHVQLLLTAGIPLAMVALHRMVDRPTWTRGFLLGTALAANALASGYYGYFAGLMVGVSVLYFAVTRGLWRSFSYWRAVALALLTAIIIVGPFFMPYLELRHEGAFAERTLEAASRYDADWRAYLASPARTHAWLLTAIGTWKEVLFPGFLTLAFAGYGAWHSVRSRSNTETAGLYALLAGLALWLTAGPSAYLYSLLYDVVPGFSLVRAPSRAGIVVTFGLTMLAAIGIARLLSRLRWRASLAAGALVLAASLELMAAPLPSAPVNPPSPAYVTLATLPPGVVAEFPFWNQTERFNRHVPYVLRSVHHWKPLLNGFSDYYPEDFRAMALRVSIFPSEDSLAVLDAMHVRYIVVHVDLYGSDVRQRLLDGIEAFPHRLKPIWRDEHAQLLALVRQDP